MNAALASFASARAVIVERLPPWWTRAVVGGLIVFGIVLPFFLQETSGFLNATIIALAYVVMALGLNIVVGFAGLLDLGYVAFYAIGAYSVGWFGSSFFFKAHLHAVVSPVASLLPGIHLNFVLIILAAIVLTSLAGVIIGLPTLRLRGDYIAIVTLAFGEIIRVFAVNGDSIHISGMPLTAGRQGITPVDAVYFPGVGSFDQLHLRPWYWTIFAIVLIVLFVNLRLRDSRLGRAWVALREDEVAAVSMGIPLVKTKLLAYASGAAFGGSAGVFFGAYLNQVNADQFEFSFSIFVLAMIIVGGLGSIWGAVLGALLLSYINYYLIPDVFNGIPSALGLSFNLTDLSFGIFGFLLVLVMVLRPQGLFPERRRALELTEAVATAEGSAGPAETG
ncbi:MAG: branched-chain amino acid transport system permease protein [Solirubrobacteraceae bacterium]|jgi:branched-chain amino acid transport system permease protein|nr:branched-chain amino acid transport system permease protein [Solirubrobacteraceae bacterium]